MGSEMCIRDSAEGYPMTKDEKTARGCASKIVHDHNEERPRERGNRGRFLPLGKKASS